MIRFIFMGSDPIALPLLDYLLSQKQIGLNCEGIFTQPDRPAGRGYQIKINPIKEWAQKHSIPTFQPEKITAIEIDWIKAKSVDLAFVMAYGQLLPKAFIQLFSKGILNFHTSLLPKYRGASPIQTALAEGASETGISLMKIVPRMDAGPIIDQISLEIASDETYSSLKDKMAHGCVELIERTLLNVTEGSFQEYIQDENQATYTRKITKSDGWIQFNIAAKLIYNRIRAFQGWPGSFFKFNNTVITVNTASLGLHEHLDAVPGTVLDISNGLAIATLQGTILFHQLQKPGGKLLECSEFLRGFPIPVGSILSTEHSILAQPLTLPHLFPKVIANL